MIPFPSSRPTIPGAPYPSLLDCMAPPNIVRPPRPRLQTSPRDPGSKDAIIRSVLTDQSMTTQQVHRAVIKLGLDITVDQLRIRLRTAAHRGIGVREVKIPGAAAEWVRSF